MLEAYNCYYLGSENIVIPHWKKSHRIFPWTRSCVHDVMEYSCPIMLHTKCDCCGAKCSIFCHSWGTRVEVSHPFFFRQWLTHWGREKMAAISRMTFPSAFPWMKFLNFNYNFTEMCFFVSNWQYGGIGSDNGLALNRRQAIIWTNDGLGYWCIYVSLSLNELISMIDRCIYTWMKGHIDPQYPPNSVDRKNERIMQCILYGDIIHKFTVNL